MSAEINVVYWLDPIPSNASGHLHKCPVPGCSHEMILRNRDSDDKSPEVGAVAYRPEFNESGGTRRVVNVRLPGMCWCGAPLPRSERVVFLASDIEENRAEAVRIMHRQQAMIDHGLEEIEAEVTV